MLRPWRIEFRYRKHSTFLGSNGEYADWTPWFTHRSRFATREAAQRMVDGDFGYYLSFAAKHETRIASRDEGRAELGARDE